METTLGLVLFSYGPSPKFGLVLVSLLTVTSVHRQ